MQRRGFSCGVGDICITTAIGMDYSAKRCDQAESSIQVHMRAAPMVLRVAMWACRLWKWFGICDQKMNGQLVESAENAGNTVERIDFWGWFD